MKLFLRIFFTGILLCLFYGIYYRTQVDYKTGERIIGFTVLSAALIYLPLFLYHRWNGKKLQDYTLTEENLKKMRENRNEYSQTRNHPSKRKKSS